MNRHLSGLYVVTPEHPGPWAQAKRPIGGLVADAIRGGARVVQYRVKEADWRQRRAEAEELAAICRTAGVPFIINDDVDLAVAVGADGVHLGRGDADPKTVRERLGARALIGVSCYDQLERATAAEQAGASYVAFGSFFPSPTKPEAVRPALELLTRARRTLGLPLVAIGGITPQNAAALIAAGADMVAVITGVFATPDVAAAAQAYNRLFSGPGCPSEDRT